MGISNINSGASSNANITQSQQMKTLLASLQRQPTLLDMLAEDNTGSSNSFGDILDLSSEGQTAADQLYQLLESASLGRTEKSADAAGISVYQKIDTALSKANIDTSKAIDLQLDSSGNVVVTGDNPRKQEIQNLIQNDPDLKKAVVEYLTYMQSIASELQTGDNSQAALIAQLRQMLSKSDSQSAVDDSDGTVTLSLDSSGFQTLYQVGDGDPAVLSSSMVQ